ncbi:hypothetical protein PtA15_5A734 [Puccinia triticina]|nr:uncharacterized protein PtA15_5A734 [Puccinia triticina]WAQ85160.1 hypothetical protein PtA15_5A734 [Puccinia triticina]
MADKEDVPDLNNTPVANITPVNQAKTTTASKPLAKRPAMALDPDDSDVKVNPAIAAPAAKRTCEGKNDAIKSGLGGLTNAIEKLAESKAKKTNGAQPAENLTCSKKAINLCSKMFLKTIAALEFLNFASILEKKDKAQTFLTLARSSSGSICEVWLQKEVSKMQSS